MADSGSGSKVTKAMALTLRAPGLVRETHIQKTTTQTHYRCVILYIIELSSCTVSQGSLGIFPVQREEDCPSVSQ